MKYKLICFDVDGTLVDEERSVWEAVHDILGIDKEKRRKAKERYFAREITYGEWADHDLKLWAEKNFKKQHLMKAIENFKLMPGTKETLIELKKRGYKLAILSGSVSLVLDKLLPEYKDIFDHLFISSISFDGKGNIAKTEWISHDRDDEGKAEKLKEICKKEGILPEQTVFIGDHDNDIPAMRIAGLKIAFNSNSEELKKAADVVIEKKDVREVLKHLQEVI